MRAACIRHAPLAPVVVGCNLRYMPSLQRVQEVLRRGVLGRIVRAQFEVGQNLAQWRPGRELGTSYSACAEQGGGVLLDLVHEVDLARWMLGPLEVASTGESSFAPALIHSRTIAISASGSTG